MGNLFTGKFGWEEPAVVPGSAFGPEWSVWVRKASGYVVGRQEVQLQDPGVSGATAPLEISWAF